MDRPSPAGMDQAVTGPAVTGEESVIPEVADENALPRRVSLAVAVSGVTAMAILAYIQRRRRVHQEMKPA